MLADNCSFAESFPPSGSGGVRVAFSLLAVLQRARPPAQVIRYGSLRVTDGDDDGSIDEDVKCIMGFQRAWGGCASTDVPPRCRG